jgi:hypothetical protein
VGAELGRVLAQSHRSWAIRIAVSLIFIVALTLPYLAWMENARTGAVIAWIVLVALWIIIIVAESRRYLAIHENGITHRRACGCDHIPWRTIRAAVFSYSYSVDPRALFRVDLISESGRKYGLDLNWRNKKQLVQILYEIFIPGERN